MEMIEKIATHFVLIGVLIAMFHIKDNEEKIEHHITHIENRLAILDSVDHENEKLRLAVSELYGSTKSLTDVLHGRTTEDENGDFDCDRCHKYKGE